MHKEMLILPANVKFDSEIILFESVLLQKGGVCVWGGHLKL